MTARNDARRIAIVGASTGLGRSVGVALAKRGDSVALLARRHEMVASAAAEAGDGASAHAIRCDVTDEAGCRAAIDEAATALGGLDAVVYSAGIGELRRIEDIDAATWHRVFATNVVGASTVAAAALPHLRASGGIAVFFSTVSASLTPSWPGMASYNVTKAAMDRLVEAWRAEHPDVGFTRLIIGECPGSDGDGASHFASGWDMSLAGEMYPTWISRGLLTDKLVGVEDFINVVDGVLRCGASACIPTVAVTPRRPI